MGGAKPNSGRVRVAGVGPLCSTNEAAEHRGATLDGGGGGKAAAQGERRTLQHQSDTERGTGVPRVERRAPNGAGKEERAVHCFAASCDAGSAAEELRSLKEGCGSRGGWRDVARVRNGTGGSACRFTQPCSSWRVSSTTFTQSLHSEG